MSDIENNEDVTGVEAPEYVTPFMYLLKAPINNTDGVTVTGINLQEPTLAEIELLATNTQKFNSIKAFQIMLANHSGLDIPTVKKLGARDFNGIQKYYDYFFGE